jgi:hypothetical protein
MSRHLFCIGPALAILTLSAPASASPAWCATEGAASFNDGLDNLESDDARDAIKSIVGVACYGNGDVPAVRNRWSKRLGMVEADWADAAVWASQDQGERMQNVIYIDLQGQKLGIGESLKRAWSSFGPFDQYAAISRGLGDNLGNDKHYVADAFGSKLSEIGRLAYLEACLATNDAQVVRWAMCEGDIAALDRAKLSTEIRADKARSGADRMAIRIRLDRFNQALAKHRDAVKAASAQDPAYAKMFELAAQTRTEWTTRWKNDAALVELTSAMDDARAKDSKKGFAGCEEATQKPFAAAVASLDGKKLAGLPDEVQNPFITKAMAAVVATPSGYLASVAYYLCRTRAGGKQDAVTRALGDAMQRWPGHRGPRSATYTAILLAGLELDTASDRIDYPDLSRAVFDGRGTRSTRGTVAKLTKEGDTVQITFNKQTKQVPECTDYRRNNRIVQIRWDGTLVYESSCGGYKMVSVDVTPPPMTVNAKYTTGLKVGTAVSVTDDVVVATWTKDGKTPTSLVGVAIK